MMKITKNITFTVDSASLAHNRELSKPNEDKLFIDRERGIFIVLDGITRPHAEYESRPMQSAAKDFGEEFLDSVLTYLSIHIDELEPKELLLNAVKTGNDRLDRLREKKSLEEWEFYPGTLGIISLLRDNVLHYVSVGDCLATLIRGNSKILFGREPALEAVDLHNVSKQDRYGIYCNHPENHLSYTIFNGDGVVMNGVEYSFIDLHEGDVLFLGSDGIGCCLKYEKTAILKEKSVGEIFEISKKYDTLPYAEYADDKTLIKLEF